MIEFAIPEEKKQVATIKVVGVGGAGGNTVNSIIESECKGIECIVVNSDVQALELSNAPHKIQIGIKSAKGLGTGANPELGKRAAEEDLDKVVEAIGHADIVFLTAGMGGGTGSGALPVIARALKEHGILSIALVTKPFLFEGKKRTQVAEAALEELKNNVDTLMITPNQKLLELVDQNVPMIEALSMINSVLSQSVKGLSDIITKPGHINVDFADVRAIMKDMGLAVLGTGQASGPDRAKKAALEAISSPLLENVSIDGAQGVLINITGGADLGLHEISEAASVIYERADENANIILGSVIDHDVQEHVSVTIIATGFTQPKKQETARPVSALLKSAAQKISTAPLHTAPAPQPAVQLVEKITEPTSCTLIPAPENQTEKKENMTTVTTKEKENNQLETKIVDLDDLDVPTFLRVDSPQQHNEE